MHSRERLAWSLVGLLVSTMLLGGGYQATNLQNGDVNGDGVIDVSDPVYLLVHLFEGGPAPAKVYSLVPETGQVECYASMAGSWQVVPCDTPGILVGQDGAIASGPPLSGRLVDNGDGTVTDQATGLMWASVMVDAPTWALGMQHCADSVLAGYSDWRMPSVNELLSAVSLGTSWTPPAPVGLARTWYDPAFFSNPMNFGADQWVWSSTTSTVSNPSGGQLAGDALCLRVAGEGPNGVPVDQAAPALESRGKGVGQLPNAVWAVRGPVE